MSTVPKTTLRFNYLLEVLTQLRKAHSYGLLQQRMFAVNHIVSTQMLRCAPMLRHKSTPDIPGLRGYIHGASRGLVLSSQCAGSTSPSLPSSMAQHQSMLMSRGGEAPLDSLDVGFGNEQ